jgi:hypothetical protein
MRLSGELAFRRGLCQLLIRPYCVATEKEREQLQILHFALHPSDEDLSLGTPVVLRSG